MKRFREISATLAILGMATPSLAETLHGTLYKDQGCPCCEGHAQYLEQNGIAIDVQPVEDIAAISEEAGMPAEYQGCHTLMLNGYAIEGHFSIEIIEKLLAEHPAVVIGISLPGMPTGVPGWADLTLGHTMCLQFTRMAGPRSLESSRGQLLCVPLAVTSSVKRISEKGGC